MNSPASGPNPTAALGDGLRKKAPLKRKSINYDLLAGVGSSTGETRPPSLAAPMSGAAVAQNPHPLPAAPPSVPLAALPSRALPLTQTLLPRVLPSAGPAPAKDGPQLLLRSTPTPAFELKKALDAKDAEIAEWKARHLALSENLAGFRLDTEALLKQLTRSLEQVTLEKKTLTKLVLDLGGIPEITPADSKQGGADDGSAPNKPAAWQDLDACTRLSLKSARMDKLFTRLEEALVKAIE